MKLDQYLFNNKKTQISFARQCGVTTRAVQLAIKKDYIIINGTVYSPRFSISEGKDNE